jgi:hypothetical protein
MAGATMTEREPEHEPLAELLDKPVSTGDLAAGDDPILTRRDEQKLLDEANQVEPPTLAPLEISLDLHLDGRQRRASSTSLGAEAIELVRRHPMTALLLAAGLAYLLTHRRKT